MIQVHGWKVSLAKIFPNQHPPEVQVRLDLINLIEEVQAIISITIRKIKIKKPVN